MNGPRIAGALLGLCGAGFALLALAYNPRTVSFIHPLYNDSMNPSVRRIQVAFGLLAAVLLLGAWAAGRVGAMRRLFAEPRTLKVLLAAAVLLTPLVTVELAFRPMALQNARTTIYEPDADLGWRLKPNCRDILFGIPVETNARGLRGPLREYGKPAETRRILFLGDSVTYGFHLESYEQTFVHLVEEALNRDGGLRVETINAGVDGYSQWQEDAYLRKEGFRYDPDLVVVGFVLNDVTEKLQLKRFGGPGEGFQLAKSVHSPIQYLTRKSGLVYFGHLLAARLWFGWNVKEGAWEQEVRTVHEVLTKPEDPVIRDAWGLTLEHMQRIVDFCNQRGFRMLLVVFPCGRQLDIPEWQHPQAMLREFAKQNDIFFIDLHPTIVGAILQGGETYEGLYLDPIHFTVRGNEIIARALSEAIEEGKLVE